MLIPLRIDRTTKPPLGAPLRSDGHWSVQGLVGAWAFNEGAAKTAFNGVTGKGTTHTRTASDSGFINGRFGAEYQSGADGAGAGFYESQTATTYTRYAVVCVHKIHTTNGFLEDVFGGTPGGTLLTSKLSSVTAAATLCYDNTNGYVFCADGSGLAVGAKSGVAPSSGIYRTVAGVYDGGFKLYIDGVLSGNNNFSLAGSFSGTFNSNGFAIADNPIWSKSAHQFHVCSLVYNRALSPAEIASISANPWQIYEPEVVWVETGVTGPTAYTDSLASFADTYATVTDIQTYIEAAQALVTANISVADTTAMLDAVLTTAQAADSVSNLAQRAESLLAVIQAADSVQSAQAMVESLVAAATAVPSVVDFLTAAGVESLQTVITAADSVQDLVTILEQVSTAITAVATVADEQISAAAENLLTAATAIASVTDLQLMVDNLTIIAQSTASLSEISAYLEKLACAATSADSVADVIHTGLIFLRRGAVLPARVRGAVLSNRIRGFTA